MARIPTDDRLLELDDGRTVGYATWGATDGWPVLIGHGTPGSRLDRYAPLDDPEWVRRQRVRFVGVDRPGYGYSDPWPEASLLDCAGDFVRVADDLGLERFAALGEEARMLREDPEAWYAGFVAAVPEVDRRVLERPEVREIVIGMFQEAVRQGALGWVDDNLRLGRPWPFRPDEVVADVSFHHGEEDTNAPPQHAKELAERMPGSRLRMYPGEGHISVFDKPIKEIVEGLLDP